MKLYASKLSIAEALFVAVGGTALTVLFVYIGVAAHQPVAAFSAIIFAFGAFTGGARAYFSIKVPVAEIVDGNLRMPNMQILPVATIAGTMLGYKGHWELHDTNAEEVGDATNIRLLSRADREKFFTLFPKKPNHKKQTQTF